MNTTQALLDVLNECRQFLEDMHTMPPEWTIKESQPLHAKLDALLAAPTAPAQQAQVLPEREALTEKIDRIAKCAKLIHEKAEKTCQHCLNTFGREKTPSGLLEDIAELALSVQIQAKNLHARAALTPQDAQTASAEQQADADGEPAGYVRAEGFAALAPGMPAIIWATAQDSTDVAVFARPPAPAQPQELPLSDPEIIAAAEKHLSIMFEEGEVCALVRALISRQPSTESKETSK